MCEYLVVEFKRTLFYKMSTYTQYGKKGGGSTSSTTSINNMTASQSTSKQSNSVHAPAQREPLRPTENVMKSQNNPIRTENSVTKVSNIFLTSYIVASVEIFEALPPFTN